MCNKVMTKKLPLLRQTLALHISIRSRSVKERINAESRDNKHDILQQEKNARPGKTKNWKIKQKSCEATYNEFLNSIKYKSAKKVQVVLHEKRCTSFKQKGIKTAIHSWQSLLNSK